MSKTWIRQCLSVLVLVACFSMLIVSNFANAKQQSKSKIDSRGKSDTTKESANPQKASSVVLGGTNRCLTFVSTDKPIYRIGDKVYIRGVLLDATTHKPLADPFQPRAFVQIKGSKGDTIGSAYAVAQDSVWATAFEIPQAQAGGEYSIHVSYPSDGYAPAERKFDVRAYNAPRLKSQITFLRDGYGCGDKVQATLDVKRAEGGVPVGAKVTAAARVDGIEIDGGTATVDEAGLCSVGFNLPTEISRGDGTLTFVIQDGGVVESAAKTIPILLQTVDLQIFPEGGDLIAGFKNRVYIQANQPNGKPADITGTLMSKVADREEAVVEFKTEHEGRGRFEFIPKKDSQYYLNISKPSGIKTTYQLPQTKLRGALIHSDQDVFKKGQPVSVHVACSDKDCEVLLSRYEIPLGKRTIKHATHGGKMVPVVFNGLNDVDGVLTVTVSDKAGVPLAERLLFRQPAKAVNVDITAEQKSYVPGDSAKLTIKSTDENGKPVSAIVGLTVTDDAILEMVDKREQSPRLPVMVFLEPEVKDLADAHVYMDANNPKAPLATDLLLGTQGWRRFALMKIEDFIRQNGDSALRVVAYRNPNGQVVPSRLIHSRIGELSNAKEKDKKRNGSFLDRLLPFKAPKEIGQVEGPRDANMFQVEPTIVDERHYTSGRDERHQKTSPTLPEGSPVPDEETLARNVGQLAALSSVDRYSFFPNMNSNISPMNNLIVVREFAHKARPNRQPTDRSDFAETLYWNAGVKTDASTGTATINFDLNDSVTSFRVFADAFGSGAVGCANIAISSVQPFYAETKPPLEVTSGDKILLPINLVNGTKSSIANPVIDVVLNGNFKLDKPVQGQIAIGAEQRVRWLQPIDVGSGNGEKEFVVNAKAGPYVDKVTRMLSVKPKGFPAEYGFGGILEPGKTVVHTVTIPTTVVAQSVTTSSAVYPTPLANLSQALQAMIQDPSGCFEQTSSTSYPLTMAQQYFLSHSGIDPKLIETSREKLTAGYNHLVGFWCPDRGYEWFGENPGHEALTAFGLLHFNDMAQVRDVDKNMMATTRAWLMKQKDGHGGFNRNRRALHTWIEDKDCSNAYILWALLETGEPASNLKSEIEALKRAVAASKNNYVVALAANALQLAGEHVDAKRCMDRLAAKQKPNGSMTDVTSSIVGSGGDSLVVEGTALATLAWLRDPAYSTNVERSIKYLADSCKDGRYGSTQATVLSLRSIVAYDKLHARPKAPGKVHVVIDGQPVGDWVAFNKNDQSAVKLPDMGELLTPGAHKVELSMQGGSAMPYSIAVKYNDATPDSAKDCKLDIIAKLATEKVTEGSSTEANVTVFNTSSEVVPNPVAIVGLPGGLEPRHDQLKELVKKHTIDAYEVRGREVVLYWRTLPANGKVNVPLSVIAAVPGTYTGPASRAYLYYTDEQKRWVDGMHVDIAAKQTGSTIGHTGSADNEVARVESSEASLGKEGP